MTIHKYITPNKTFILTYVDGMFSLFERIDGDKIDFDATRHFIVMFEEFIDLTFLKKIE